ncbi:MAG: AtpZ/AtpI family protein [Phycisphaerales bacterium]
MSDPDRSPNIARWRQNMGGWSAGIDFAATAITCVLIGFGIDFFAGTSPWFLTIFLVVGIVGGFVAFVRTAMRVNRGPKH